MLNFPLQIKVEEIDRKHPWREGMGPVWENARLLYEGGHKLQNQAGRFLTKRHTEPGEIYTERLGHFSYEGTLGTAVSYYSEALSEDPLKISIEGDSESERDIFTRLLARAWRDERKRGSSITDLSLQVPADWLVYCISWTLIERIAARANSRSEELNEEALWPYAVLLDPEAVINWFVGDDGELEWAVVRSDEVSQPDPFSRPRKVTRWRVYDRESVAVYWQIEEGGKLAELESEPVSHALSNKGLVPLVRSEVPRTLWLADRALLSIEAGIRAASAVDWAIEQSALAIPVIAQDGDVQLVKSNTAYIKLDSDGKAYFLESSGRGIEAGQESRRLDREAAFRQMHLSQISRDSMALPSAQSGASKAFDFKASSQVMQALGIRTRRYIRTVSDYLRKSLDLAGELTVSGMDFSEPRDMPELDQARAAREMDLDRDAPTLWRHIRKQHARRQLDDASAAVLEVVEAEIDSAPNARDVRDEALGGQASNKF